MLPIQEYLLFGLLPKDPQKARKLRVKAPQYKIIDGDLYCKSYLSPWLRLVLKIMKIGYYWPSMHIDAKAQIQRCEACQIHSPVLRKPKQEMTSIILACPFSWWGIDIVGPLLMAPGGARFLVVAIDYFTKWVDAKPLVSITGKHMKKFV
ncbi:reverse transcriptase domain-containing protein [Tanacetum coccineum]